MSMGFLTGLKKDLAKAGHVEGSQQPPSYWFSLGNYVLNRILGGTFVRGLPQGRVTGLAGPSGAGKSFIVCNAMREAQKDGAHILVLDSENALDDEFVTKIGVDVSEDKYTYFSVTTIAEVLKIVSAFVKGYTKEYGDHNEDAPKILVVIDSLDMLLTETEEENFEKGVQKGDQGQRNKQLKAMLRQFVQAIKHLNITIACTVQVYKNQDVKNGEGVWIVPDAVKYSLSHIVLLTKLKLKDKSSGGIPDVLGVRIKAEGYKTRFTKPYQVASLEVPYETGMDPFNGMVEVAEALGIVEKKGAWKYFEDEKWNSAEPPNDIKPRIMAACDAMSSAFLDRISDEFEEDNEKPDQSNSSRRLELRTKKKELEED